VEAAGIEPVVSEDPKRLMTCGLRGYWVDWSPLTTV
jgi:hypothetical protein